MRCDERWRLWRDIVVRGTGFPVAVLASLSLPAPGRACDDWLRAEAARTEANATARRLCYTKLAACDADRRRAWRAAMRQLKQGRLPPPSGDADFDACVAELGRTQSAADAAAAEFDRVFGDSARATTKQLRRWAADEHLREAVAWQNPPAVATALDPLLEAPVTADGIATSARHELLVARYLQRYAAKNDTVGFFGPVGWAEVGGDDRALDMRPGPRITVDDRADFEPWAVGALAQAIAADGALRVHLRPWRHPSLRAGAGPGELTLLERAFRLPPLEQVVLALCDGRRSVGEVLDAAAPGAGHRADAGEALERLVAGSFVSLAPRVPATADAIDRLRNFVDALPRCEARDGWLRTIDALRASAADAAGARGRPDDVLRATHRLAEEFARHAGRSAYRPADHATWGRSLLCLDTTRDLELTIGEPLARDLADALRPVLDAAHWFSCQVHAQLAEFADALFDEHARGGRIPLDALWLQMQRRGEAVRAIVDDVVEQLAERWAEATSDASPSGTAAGAAAVFGDATSDWPGARFQAPDVMIAAASAEEAAEAQFVLGELHPADRSLMREVFVARHPDRAALRRSVEAAQPEPELRPLIRTRDPQARMRTMPEADFVFDIECDTVVSPQPAQRVLRSGALWVERRSAGLRIVDRDNGREFPWHSFLGPQVTVLGSQRFRLYAPAPYRPRVTIGRLVVARETWRLDLAPFAAWRRLSRSARYTEVRRLARSLGWPRWVFYRLPGQPKPLYLDLDSLCFVDLFARMASAAACSGHPTAEVTEMLPTPEQCWLADCRGDRYTSEWRMLFLHGEADAGAHS